DEEEGVRAADAALLRVPDARAGHAGGVELGDARIGGALERVEITKENRAGRTRLRARRLEPRFLPVVAEGALEGAAVVGPPVDDGRAFKCTFCYDRQKAWLEPAC